MPLSYLSDDEQSYFLDMESLFNHPGWERLTREIRAELDVLPADAFLHAKAWEDVLKHRARHEALKTLVSYPEAVELRRRNLEHAKATEIDGIGEL